MAIIDGEETRESFPVEPNPDQASAAWRNVRGLIAQLTESPSRALTDYVSVRNALGIGLPPVQSPAPVLQRGISL